MVLKYVTKKGTRIHEPPYTKAEEDEFYRRVGRGPITVARPAGDKTTDKKSAAIKRNLDPPPDARSEVVVPLPMPSERTSYWREFAR
jgi:hypothetical protein